MVWLCFALCTEILTAGITSYPILSHVLSCLHRYRLSHDHLTRNHLHHISARATYHVRVVFDDVHNLTLVNDLLVFLRQKLAALEVQDLLAAPWAADRLRCRHPFYDLLPEAIDVYLMEALSGLQHVKILINLIIFADELVAKLAEGILTELLHLLVYRRSPLLLIQTQNIIHVLGLNLLHY